jgi:hypothetical protein
MWFLSKRTTDQKSRKVCVQCDIWRELYESEKTERRDLQHLIFMKFGVINESRDPMVERVTQPIQNHRPSQVLRELEQKKRKEAQKEIEDRLANGALDAPAN